MVILVGVLGAVAGGRLLWSSVLFSGTCSPEVERLNAACAFLEVNDVRVTCSSPTGTREWTSCETRNEIRLSWDEAPDSGWLSRPYAIGRVSDAVETTDAGPWACSNGAHSLSLYPSSIPAGEEARAALAFRNTCARFMKAAY